VQSEKSNVQVDAVVKRQITNKTVQRAVRHGVLGPQLSTWILLQIPAQSVHSIIGAMANFLWILDTYVAFKIRRIVLRSGKLTASSYTPPDFVGQVKLRTREF
jgi:hypothetical protein